MSIEQDMTSSILVKSELFGCSPCQHDTDTYIETGKPALASNKYNNHIFSDLSLNGRASA